MKKKSKTYTIILAMVFLGVHGAALAAASPENIDTFLEKINEIRSAPYSYALNLGYDSQFLIEKGIHPDTTKYDPYFADDALTAMAEDDSKSMAGEILETKKPVHRFTASTGGVISFFNFMPRETAFKIVIDHLFKKELEAMGTPDEFLHILSETRYSSAGVAVSPGKVGTQNAWFVAIRLGSSQLVSEVQMLTLINQVRAEPARIWNYAQSDPAEALNKNPDVLYLSASEYPPLFFDASLGASAQDRSLNQLSETYPEFFGETQTYLMAPLDRADFHGYDGEAVQERGVHVVAPKEDGGVSVEKLFSYLIQYELEAWPRDPAVFSMGFQDAGSDITSLAVGDKDLAMLSFVVGKKNEPVNNDELVNNDIQISRIYGILFSDDDGNDLYSPEEELIQQAVTVYAEDMQAEDMPVVQQVVTDNAGHFYMELDASRRYRFEATIEGVLVIRDIFITSDQFLQLEYSPPDALSVP